LTINEAEGPCSIISRKVLQMNFYEIKTVEASKELKLDLRYLLEIEGKLKKKDDDIM